MSTTTEIVSEKVPWADCKCMVWFDCSKENSARYTCELQVIKRDFSDNLSEGIQLIPKAIITLTFILFPLFVIITVVRFIFFLKKSDRFKAIFIISLATFLIVLVLCLLKITAPYPVYR